jgi:glycosyltransferase involved in cell wall biosynthesis
MNIAIYIPVLNIGGAEKVIINLSKQLVLNTSNNYFLITDINNSTWLDQLDPSLKILDVNSHQNLFYRIKQVKQLIISNQIDLVFSHLTHANIHMLMLKCLFKFKLVIVEHSITSDYVNDLGKVRFVFNILLKRLLNKADKIVSVSNTTKVDLIKSYNVSEKKCDVIYNPFDFERIAELGDVSLGDEIKNWIDNRKLIISVGRLEEHKNHLFLVNALNEYLKQKNYCLLIVGDGSAKEILQNFINLNELNSHVKLVGYENNPYKYIIKSNLLVHPSKFEGFGLVLLEALYLEVPVVSMNFKTAYEVLEGGELGKIVTNETDLLTNIDKALNENVKPILSFKITEKYKLSNVAAQYETLFNSIMYNVN